MVEPFPGGETKGWGQKPDGGPIPIQNSQRQSEVLAKEANNNGLKVTINNEE